MQLIQALCYLERNTLAEFEIDKPSFTFDTLAVWVLLVAFSISSHHTPMPANARLDGSSNG